MAKESENAGKALQSLTSEYDNLKSSLEKIGSLTGTISTLTKGTLEWKEAAAKLNQEVLSLLKLYP